jgi:hypothetical protein
VGIMNSATRLRRKNRCDNMPLMAKKEDAHKGTQIPFRVDDDRLVEALEAYAARIRRSRNMAIVLLLEEALKAHDLWPPPTPPKTKDAK